MKHDPRHKPPMRATVARPTNPMAPDAPFMVGEVELVGGQLRGEVKDAFTEWRAPVIGELIEGAGPRRWRLSLFRDAVPDWIRVEGIDPPRASVSNGTPQTETPPGGNRRGSTAGRGY